MDKVYLIFSKIEHYCFGLTSVILNSKLSEQQFQNSIKEFFSKYSIGKVVSALRSAEARTLFWGESTRLESFAKFLEFSLQVKIKGQLSALVKSYIALRFTDYDFPTELKKLESPQIEADIDDEASISGVCDSGKLMPMKYKDLKENANYFGVKIVDVLPQSREGIKFTIIDSDYINADYSSNDIVTLYQNYAAR